MAGAQQKKIAWVCSLTDDPDSMDKLVETSKEQFCHPEVRGIQRFLSLGLRMLAKLPVHYILPLLAVRLGAPPDPERDATGLMVAATRRPQEGGKAQSRIAALPAICPYSGRLTELIPHW
jgi:hypothetical protein